MLDTFVDPLGCHRPHVRVHERGLIPFPGHSAIFGTGHSIPSPCERDFFPAHEGNTKALRMRPAGIHSSGVVTNLPRQTAGRLNSDLRRGLSQGATPGNLAGESSEGSGW